GGGGSARLARTHLLRGRPRHTDLLRLRARPRDLARRPPAARSPRRSRQHDGLGGMITSASNPRLKLVRKLASGRQRAKLGLFACEGEALVAVGLSAGIRPVDVLVDAERQVEIEGLEDAEEVKPGLLAELSALAHPPRI